MKKENINYEKICRALLKDLTERQKSILQSRFGLFGKKVETLQEIGGRFGITRERIRQIEKNTLKTLRKSPCIEKAKPVFVFAENFLKQRNGVCREDTFLEEIPSRFRNEFIFLLHLDKNLFLSKENDLLYRFWCLDSNLGVKIEKIVKAVLNKLETEKKPLDQNKILEFLKTESQEICFASLDIAKQVEKGCLGGFGLVSWSEINPKNIRDNVFLALKKNKKPMHFRDIASSINKLPQTVHNELIKGEEFILVGRGIYGLKEWGLEKGTVLDIIKKVIRKSGGPLTREEILELVLKERLVKPATVLLNLNKNCFEKNKNSKYIIKEA